MWGGTAKSGCQAPGKLPSLQAVVLQSDDALASLPSDVVWATQSVVVEPREAM